VLERMGLAVGKPANLHLRLPYLLVEVKESVDKIPLKGMFGIVTTGNLPRGGRAPTLQAAGRYARGQAFPLELLQQLLKLCRLQESSPW
jgi:hypothetical protein